MWHCFVVLFLGCASDFGHLNFWKNVWTRYRLLISNPETLNV